MSTALVEQRLATLPAPVASRLALVLPQGKRFGPASAEVTLRLNTIAALAHVVSGRIGRNRVFEDRCDRASVLHAPDHLLTLRRIRFGLP